MTGAAEVVAVDTLHESLATADLVVLALALTPETAGVMAAPELAAIPGNFQEISPFINQCEKLPRLWPLARTALGKTSEMYTQITAP